MSSVKERNATELERKLSNMVGGRATYPNSDDDLLLMLRTAAVLALREAERLVDAHAEFEEPHVTAAIRALADEIERGK